jgi:hypothetical protein
MASTMRPSALPEVPRKVLSFGRLPRQERHGGTMGALTAPTSDTEGGWDGISALTLGLALSAVAGASVFLILQASRRTAGRTAGHRYVTRRMSETTGREE